MCVCGTCTTDSKIKLLTVLRTYLLGAIVACVTWLILLCWQVATFSLSISHTRCSSYHFVEVVCRWSVYRRRSSIVVRWQNSKLSQCPSWCANDVLDVPILHQITLPLYAIFFVCSSQHFVNHFLISGIFFYCIYLQIEDAMLMFDKQTNRHRGKWTFY